MTFKKKILTAILTFSLIFTFFIGNFSAEAKGEILYLGGIPAGFTVKTKGAVVIGLSDIVTEDGVFSPSKNADIKIGDLITKIGNEEICGAQSVAKELNKSNGEPIEITVVRNGEEINKFLTPKKDKDGNYKLGLFLREDLNGIGTITYFTEKGDFVALGHPILNDNGDILELKCGSSFLCSIIGAEKGEKGKAGELKGIFVDDKKIGCILKNTKTGIYGKIENEFEICDYPQTEISTAKMGKASILTCIDGIEPKEYQISIVKIDTKNKENKNFVIKILDKSLISQTNGILQGMSGSPIIQEGKIVGAVTHVFINDPTRGYGISIDKMIENN